ncbi:MAG: signal transduction histidine kinase/CheY-like chemotaxis protein [Saprospiraceae bacterium]|jgi:signal transduction histidine kinase/CheY-like chemotaxis protein
MGNRHFNILILCLILPLFSFGNSPNLDSLQNTIKNLSGAERANKLNQMSQDLLLVNIGTANIFAKQALNYATKIGDKDQQAIAKDRMGDVFQEKSDFTNAMKSYVEALKIRDEINDEAGIGISKNNIGLIFLLQEDYTQAEENLKEALVVKQEMKDDVGASVVLNNLGDIYLARKLYGKSLEHYRSALDMKLAAEDNGGASKIANHIGEISSDLGDYEGALTYYQMSLNLHSSTENLPKIAEDHNNIAEVLIKMRAYEEAKEMNEIALNIRKELKDNLGIAESLKNKGQILFELGDKEAANIELSSTKNLLKSIGAIQGSQLIYKDLSVIYSSMGSYENAFAAQLKYAEQKDFLFNQEKSKALLDLTTKYESEFAAEEQARTIETLEVANTNAQKIRYFLFVVIGLIGLFLMSLFLSYKRKQKDNELLLTKNEEIHKQKDEIDQQNEKLEASNGRLDLLNSKLVDEIAERESIEKSSFARDRFLATMSHEMRTPINIIIGLTHLLLDEEPREDQIEHLRTLQFSANNLVVFINDVLDFSKIEAGKLELESREFRPKRIFKDIRDRFGLLAKEKGIRVNYNFDQKIPDYLLGDSARLNQIVTNLLTASFNYTDEGQVDVNLELSELGKRDATLMLHIKDTGKGIEPEKIEEMFKSFVNNPNDIFEGYATSNLSLAITKRLVDLQNGKIEVDTHQNGNSFTVLLPYKLPLQKKVEEKSKPSYHHLAGNRILLVEDNKINQLVVAKMLRRLKMEVVTADDGLIALDKFEEGQFDLVLMDIQMPNMDGYRTTAEIRKHIDPNRRDVPIIALTASAFLTEKEKAKLFGMNDHVGKPFGPEELLEKISSSLQVHKGV